LKRTHCPATGKKQTLTTEHLENPSMWTHC
jgi:hypothetical protein